MGVFQAMARVKHPKYLFIGGDAHGSEYEVDGDQPVVSVRIGATDYTIPYRRHTVKAEGGRKRVFYAARGLAPNSAVSLLRYYLLDQWVLGNGS